MPTVDGAIADALIEVAKSSAVDVVTKQSVKPWVRGVGRAYKFYSLVEPATGIYNAVRIAAYGDVVGILAQELVIKVASDRIAKALIRVNGANFEVAQQAERYLLSSEFAAPASAEEQTLGLPAYDRVFVEAMGQEFESGGKFLFDGTIVSIRRAMRAYQIVNELLQHPESAQQRRNYRWDRRDTWIDAANEKLGYALWRPVPEVGLGLMSITSDSTYRGIVRRDDAEGYGRIEWSNGRVYFGQVCKGWPLGYGVSWSKKGSIFVGRSGGSFAPSLGALISTSKDSVYYGQYQNDKPMGYGRRIGLKNGVESVNGMWFGENDVQPVPTLASTYRKIVQGMEGSSFTRELEARYRNMQHDAERVLNGSDSAILSALRPLL